MGLVIIFIVVQIVVAGIVIFVLTRMLQKELINTALEKLQSISADGFPKEILIRSAGPLNDEIQSRAQAIVKRKSDEAKIIFQEDASLKGGMTIEYAQTVLDFSIAGRLKKLWS